MKFGRPSITARLDIARMLRKNKVWLWGISATRKGEEGPERPHKNILGA
jgi:hypothetical protein